MQFAFMIPAGPDKDGRKASHPQEQVRQKFRIAYKGNRQPFPKPYPLKYVEDAKELVAQYTMVAMRKADIRKVTDEPLEITTCFFFSRTPAQDKAKIKLPFPSIKPDLDNLWKLGLDAMEDVLYTNDARVVNGGIYKRYTHLDAYTVVAVRSLEEHEAMPPWEVYSHLAWVKEFLPKTDW